jgi:hypothetical protein
VIELEPVGAAIGRLVDTNQLPVAGQVIDELCVGDQLSKDRLLELLRQDLTEPLVATRLLLDARERAAAENKRILIQETATWCGPCHRLSRLLDANRSWEKDYNSCAHALGTVQSGRGHGRHHAPGRH